MLFRLRLDVRAATEDGIIRRIHRTSVAENPRRTQHRTGVRASNHKLGRAKLLGNLLRQWCGVQDATYHLNAIDAHPFLHCRRTSFGSPNARHVGPVLDTMKRGDRARTRNICDGLFSRSIPKATMFRQTDQQWR